MYASALLIPVIEYLKDRKTVEDITVKYRSEIDGLRAVAVVPVVLFHAGLPLFDGGYLGVDVFFVISGYLITTIILDDIAAKRFSILTFYEKRCRRILPAFVVMVLGSLVPAWLWMMPDEMRNFGQSVFASSIFSSNILFWTEAGYFSTGSEMKPLLHTWSLSVEEQFYLFFPLMLLALSHLRWRWTLLTIVLIAVFSLGLSELGWRRWPLANFYLLPFRAWELGMGALSAIFLRLYGERSNTLLSGVGFLVLAASFALFDDTTPMPSVYGLAPVLGTVLILVFASPDTWAGRLLSLKPIVLIGLISYSTYLWHQPLLAFTRIRSIPSATDFALLLAVAASFGLGYVSWRFVEQPFRKGGHLFSLPRTGILSGSIAVLVGLGVVGLWGSLGGGFPGRLPDRAVTLASYVNDRSPLEGEDRCTFFSTRRLTEQPVRGCDMFLEDGRADVVFIGDSHSGAIAYDAQIALREIGISSYGITYSGCLGLRGFQRIGMPEGYDCLGYNEQMVAFAREVGATVLVITGRFPLYVTGERFDNGEGGVEHGGDVLFDRAGEASGTSELHDLARIERMLTGITDEVSRLTDEFNIVFVEPIPEAGWSVPQLAAKTAFFQNEESFTISTDHAAYRSRGVAISGALDAVESDRLFRVRPEVVFCDRPDPGRCINADQDEAFYFDNNHLSRTGARQLVPDLVTAMRAALELSGASVTDH